MFCFITLIAFSLFPKFHFIQLRDTVFFSSPFTAQHRPAKGEQIPYGWTTTKLLFFSRTPNIQWAITFGVTASDLFIFHHFPHISR